MYGHDRPPWDGPPRLPYGATFLDDGSANVTSRPSTRYWGVGESDLATLTVMLPTFEEELYFSAVRTNCVHELFHSGVICTTVSDPANSAIGLHQRYLAMIPRRVVEERTL